MKKLIALASIMLFSLSFVSAASPVLFFSDITSGPNTGGQDNNGAFVTIFGNNFGAARGSSYITVGGGNVSRYIIWGENNAFNPNLDMISFQLGSNAQTGNIVLHTSDGDSNPLPFVIRPGNIYFVDDNSPNTPGTGTYADPWRSPSSYTTLLATGVDGATLYFREGNYSGEYAYTGWHSNFCLTSSHSGSAGNENAFVGYPGETALIQTNNATADRMNFRAHSTNPEYIVVSNLNTYSLQGSIGVGGNSRIIGNKLNGIHTLSATGTISIVSGSSGYNIYGNEISGGSSGNKLDHAFYPSEGSNIDFGWNYIHDNNFNEGPMISINHDTAGTNNWQFLNYRIHDNVIDVTAYPSRAMGVYETGAGSIIYYYNNIIKGNPPFANPSVYAASANVYYYNNLLYGTGYNSAPSFDFYGISSNNYNYTPESITLRNNIVYSNTNSPYYMRVSSANGMPIPSLDSNLWFGIGSFASRSSGNCGNNLNSVESDPLFVNAPSDLNLQSSSPAINAGTSLVSSIVLKDFNGMIRPQEIAFDIGAYEFVSASNQTQNQTNQTNQTVYHEADLNQNSHIETSEIMTYISRFKLGSVTRANMLDGVMNFFKGRYN